MSENLKNKEIKIKKECNCNTKNDYLGKGFFRLLLLAVFIMCCIITCYLLKLWNVGKVVEKLPK